ncbi:MAG: hypothetical protein K6G00_04450 [Treponema sp.]|nr:hypothetical protein [Treponema sp.]
MPIKLIAMLIVAVLTAVFTGYNLGNSCDVWIIHTFKNVPVFITIIVSVMVGVVITLPFTMGRRVTREDKKILKADKKAKKIQAKQEKKDKKDKKSKKPVAETPVDSQSSDLAVAGNDTMTSDTTLLPESSSIEYSDTEHIPSEAD